MNLQRDTEEPLRILLHLAEHHPESDCPVSQVASHTGVPPRRVRAHARRLAARGDVTLRGGNLRLTRAPAQIPLGAVIDHMEGPWTPLQRTEVAPPPGSGLAHLRRTLELATQELHRMLCQYSLEQMLPRVTDRAAASVSGAPQAGTSEDPPARHLHIVRD